MKLAMRIGVAVVAVALVGIGVAYMRLSGALESVSAATSIGSAVADFALPDVLEGKEYTLAAHKEKEIVVLAFVSQKCPFSRGADPDMNAIAEKYKDKGVVFYGIDSHFETPASEIKPYIAEAKIPYPILKDAGNVYADALGAKVTPEVFVVDKSGNLAFHGSPDNRTGPDGTPTKRFLDDALAALTSGKEVEVKEATTWGCGIKRAK